MFEDEHRNAHIWSATTAPANEHSSLKLETKKEKTQYEIKADVM